MLERSFAVDITSYDLTISIKLVLVGSEPFDANWPTRVQLTGADSQLGAEAISEAIGEARRGVVIHAGSVNSLHEMCRRQPILSDDHFRMAGTVPIDMRNCFICIIDDLDRDN